MNLLTIIFLLAISLGIAVQCYLGHRHINHILAHRDELPEAFRSKIPLDAHQKAANYTTSKVRTGLFELLISTLILLAWTLFGGLQFLSELLQSFDIRGLWIGVGFIMSVILISSILDIPMSAYRTFKLEQKFGFNKMTVNTFISDLIKNTLLAIVIGTPIITLVLWLMENTGQFWWLYVWFTWLLFSLFMMWAYPAFIAPIFNEFRPLENAALRQRIEDLLTRNGFTSQGIFVMDGSVRSTHGNAYFTGLGTNKRIVFFDTLIDELSHEEIEAVLAHELGHFKCNHIKKRIVVLATAFFIGLAILGWLIDQTWFYQALGVNTQSTYMALTLFFMVSPVFTFFLQPVFSYISRKHEFEADDFAANSAHTENLIEALVKLYRDNANTLTPDPLYSAFHDSHPPAPVRIAHLSEKLGSIPHASR